MQTDEALRSARQAEAVAQLSVGELATAAAFFEADGASTATSSRSSPAPCSTGEPDDDRHRQEGPGAPEAAAFEARNGFEIVERGPGGLPGRSPGPARFTTRSPTSSPSNRRSGPGLRPRHGPLQRGPRTIDRAATPASRPPPGSCRCCSAGTPKLIVYQPVYRDGAPTATVAQRRAALLGFAAGALQGRRSRRRCASPAIPRTPRSNSEGRQGVVIGARRGLEDPARAPIHDRRPHLGPRPPRSRRAQRRPADPDGGGRHLARLPARGAGPDLEPQRAHGGAAAPGRPGLADRAEEPPPLRGGPARGDGPRSPRRARPAPC